MILDSFRLHTTIFQVTYSEAFIFWDRAGEIARRLRTIWSDLALSEIQPQHHLFRGRRVSVQTGLSQSTVTLSGANALDPGNVRMLKDAYDIWREELNLADLRRVSMLTTYAKEFPTMRDANREMLNLELVRWPKSQVFDQPVDADKNAVEAHFRFEDEKSFSTLRFRTESTKFEAHLDAHYVDETDIEVTKYQLLITFDRGMLGTIVADKFRVEDWVKGYQHLLHRDIEKITKAS